jgi:radical SAM superfamily enzyme YgiQ (UPF0313 family)
MDYHSILFFSTAPWLPGRIIAGARLRTAAKAAGFETLVADCTFFYSAKQMLEIIECNITEATKIVGFSTSWISTKNHKFEIGWITNEFFNEIRTRWPQLKIVMGGHFGGTSPLSKYADYNLHGDSDFSFVELLKKLSGNPDHSIFIQRDILTGKFSIDSNSSNPLLHPDDIETVFLEKDIIRPWEALPLETSRGCIFSCSYCDSPHQGKKSFDSYIRTPQSIANELRRNYAEFGTTRYIILDDTFNDSMEKLNRLETAIELSKIPKFEFCSFIRPELLVVKPEMIPKLASIGLRGATLGLESFNNESRKAIGRGMDINRVLEACYKMAEINNKQIRIHAGIIIGLPADTIEMLYKWHDFLFEEQHRLFSSWNFFKLYIKHGNNFLPQKSKMDRDPAAFGYEIIGNDAEWKNKHMDYQIAGKLQNEFTARADVYAKKFIGGWRVGRLWNMNRDVHDLDIEQLDWNAYHLNRGKVMFDTLTRKA